MADWIQGYICTALVGEVFGFPIVQSPPDVAQIFWTCQLHTAWQLLKENGDSEHPAALLWSSAFTKPPLFQRNRLTCSGNPTLESCLEVKAQQR